MTLEKIAVGMQVANYKELCRLLDEPVKAGNSKTAQIKEFARYFSHEKHGNAYIITAICEVPEERKDGRQRYAQLVEPILMNYLANNQAFPETWNKWFEHLGMVDRRFYDDVSREKVVQSYVMNSYTLYYLTNIANRKMREILKGSLKNMKKRGLIDFREVWMVVLPGNAYREATEQESSQIVIINDEVLHEMGYSNYSQIVLSPSRYREYTEKSRQRIEEETNWSRVYKAVSIVLMGDVGNKYLDLDTEPLQKKLNKEVCGTIVKSAHKAFDKMLDKGQQAWFEGDEKTLTALSKFSFPVFFKSDVEMLAQDLMYI